jgi:hypothetical protein
MENISMPRIIYISTRTKAPAGGVKVIFQHVQGLRELGYDAYVGHPIDGYQPDWFDADIPILYYLKGLKVYPDDIFVIPETGHNTLRLLRKVSCRKIVFCQNWAGIKQGLGDADHWRDFGITGVMCCSAVVGNCVKSTLGYEDLSVITCPIDHSIFKAGEKLDQIAFMPRKRKDDVGQIQTFFNLMNPGSRFKWVSIDGQTQGEVARILGESAIFLSLSKREGLGLPPLEAMAAGCLVAGFHGVGGLEYANKNNGLWCGEEDLVDCARQLTAACRLVERGGEQLASLVSNGQLLAKTYSFARMKSDLDRFWKGFLAR